MAYTAVNKSNILYQPRENLITLLESVLPKDVKILANFPNLKDFAAATLPFIVIPDASEEESDSYVGTTGIKKQNGEIEGTIYVDKQKLGDGKLRKIKQLIIQSINDPVNEIKLRSFGIDDISISFDKSPLMPVIIEQKEMIDISFTITYITEVAY